MVGLLPPPEDGGVLDPVDDPSLGEVEPGLLFP